MTTKAALTPQERLAISRAEIVTHMQNDHQLLHILKPVVAGYAKSNPIKTMGIAAGVGATLVFLKPWRLIKIDSVLAMLKLRK